MNFHKCRPEVADDVISSAAIDLVGVDVRVKFSDSGLNGGRISLLFGRPDPFNAFLCSIQLHFAADAKKLVMSYLAVL